MSIAALVCKVALGVGAVNIYPGVVESPRYDDTSIVIEFADGAPKDIVVNGPLDKMYRYSKAGIAVQSNKLGEGWAIDALAVDGSVRERLVIDSKDGLYWTQASYADKLNVVAVSIFIGQCQEQ